MSKRSFRILFSLYVLFFATLACRFLDLPGAAELFPITTEVFFFVGVGVISWNAYRKWSLEKAVHRLGKENDDAFLALYRAWTDFHSWDRTREIIDVVHRLPAWYDVRSRELKRGRHMDESDLLKIQLEVERTREAAIKKACADIRELALAWSHDILERAETAVPTILQGIPADEERFEPMTVRKHLAAARPTLAALRNELQEVAFLREDHGTEAFIGRLEGLDMNVRIGLHYATEGQPDN